MGVDVNVIASSGWNRCYEGVGETPLYRAAACGDWGYAQILLQHGAVVNVRCRDGETALCRAVAVANFKLVRLLLDAGAIPTIPNQYGSSPFQMMRNIPTTTLQKHNLTSEHQTEILALMEHEISKYDEQRKDTEHYVRRRKIFQNPQNYRILLQEKLESIDWKTFVQLLEMDKPDEGTEHCFSRRQVLGLFSIYQEIIPKARDSLYVYISLQLYPIFKENG